MREPLQQAEAMPPAQECADVAIVYLPGEQADAEITRRQMEAEGRSCLMLAGDLSDPDFCREVSDRVAAEHGKLVVLVSSAAFRLRKESLEELAADSGAQTYVFFVSEADSSYVADEVSAELDGDQT